MERVAQYDEQMRWHLEHQQHHLHMQHQEIRNAYQQMQVVQFSMPPPPQMPEASAQMHQQPIAYSTPGMWPIKVVGHQQVPPPAAMPAQAATAPAPKPAPAYNWTAQQQQQQQQQQQANQAQYSSYQQVHPHRRDAGQLMPPTRVAQHPLPHAVPQPAASALQTHTYH